MRFRDFILNELTTAGFAPGSSEFPNMYNPNFDQIRDFRGMARQYYQQQNPEAAFYTRWADYAQQLADYKPSGAPEKHHWDDVLGPHDQNFLRGIPPSALRPYSSANNFNPKEIRFARALDENGQPVKDRKPFLLPSRTNPGHFDIDRKELATQMHQKLGKTYSAYGGAELADIGVNRALDMALQKTVPSTNKFLDPL